MDGGQSSTACPPSGSRSRLPPSSDIVKKYRAFLCHAGPEKQTIVSVLLHFIDAHKKRADVFYDGRMPRESSHDDTLAQRISDALCGTETLIVFLSWEFLRRKWPMLEVQTFLGMMEREPSKKIFPVFYGISAADCKSIAKGENLSNAPYCRDEICVEHRELLGKLMNYAGTNARLSNRELDDMEVVQNIMAAVFGVDIKVDEGLLFKEASQQVILTQRPGDDELYIRRKVEISEVGRLKGMVAAEAKKCPSPYGEKICIFGTAFCGKTAMARSIAAELIQEFPNQFFLDIRGSDGPPMNISDALALALQQSRNLDLNFEMLKEEGPDRLFGYYSRVIEDGCGPTLIVIDDVGGNQVKDVCRYLIPDTIVLPLVVIVTSRDSTAVEELKEKRQFRTVNVSNLDEDEVIELFRKGCKSKCGVVSEDQLKIAGSQCLPVIGWARIMAAGAVYSDFATSLEEFPLLREDEEISPRGILRWGVGQLRKNKLGAVGVTLLKVLTVFPQSFSRDAALEVASMSWTRREALEDGREGKVERLSVFKGQLALNLLVRNAFLVANEDEILDIASGNVERGTRYAMHPAVREEIRKLEGLQWRPEAISVYEASHSCYYGRLFRAAMRLEGRAKGIWVFTQERSNLEHGMGFSKSSYFCENLDILKSSGNLFCLNLLDQETVGNALRRESEDKAEKDDCKYAELLNLHGHFLYGRDKDNEALAKFREAVETYKKLGIRETFSYADAISKIGRALSALDRHEEAIKHHEEAVEILEKLQVRESVNCALAILEIGTALSALDRDEEAIKHHEEAVEIFEKLQVRESVNCARAISEIGRALSALDRYEEAIKHHEEAVEIFEKLQVRESVNCALAISEIGTALSALDRHEEAIKHHEQAVEIFEKLQVRESVDCALAISRIGTALSALDRHEDAIKHHKEAVEVFEKLGVRRSANCAAVIFYLGGALVRLGEYDEAMKHFTEALSIYENLRAQNSLGYVFIIGGVA